MDDLEFVRRFVAGDRQAREDFLVNYSRLIYSYIHHILVARGFSLGHGHAEEIFQGIFCSLIDDDCRKLRSFKAKNGCSLATWLRQVTINFTLSFLRKLKPMVALDEEISGGSSLADILFDDSPSTRDLAGQAERLDKLQECISGLDNEDKYFIELHIHQDLGFEELKDYLKVSRGAFDMRKSRILTRLKECFKSKGFMLDF